MVVWDGEDMSPLHTQQLRSRVPAKDLWVTDVVLLPNANQVTFRPQLALTCWLAIQPTFSLHFFS